MDFSRLNNRRVVVGGIASILLIVSILFLPWYCSRPRSGRRRARLQPGRLDLRRRRRPRCTGFETFPILRWLLLLAALAPLILGYIIVRGHKLSYPPGEITMLSGFAAFVLIAYNGLIDKPGSGPAEIGLSLDYGYWIALACAIAIALVGFTRSIESGPRKTRKAPGTV